LKRRWRRRLFYGLSLIGLYVLGATIWSLLEIDILVYRQADLVKSDDPLIRQSAVLNIGIHTQKTWFLRVFSERIVFTALDDPDPRVRVKAVAGVEYMMDRAWPAYPRLFELVDDPDSHVRSFAVRVLLDLGPIPPTKPAREILPCLESSDVQIRRDAVGECLRHGRGIKPMLPQIAQLCDDSDPVVRRRVVELLILLDKGTDVDREASLVLERKYQNIPRTDVRWQELKTRFERDRYPR
jgi:HEAT repeat protein